MKTQLMIMWNRRVRNYSRNYLAHCLLWYMMIAVFLLARISTCKKVTFDGFDWRSAGQVSLQYSNFVQNHLCTTHIHIWNYWPISVEIYGQKRIKVIILSFFVHDSARLSKYYVFTIMGNLFQRDYIGSTIVSRKNWI